MRLIHPEQMIETERLRLAPLQPHHATYLFPLLQHPAIYAYIPQEPPVSLPALMRRYQALVRRLSPAGDQAWLNWAVQLTATSAYIGSIQATVFEDQTAYLAYEIGPAFWGRGYATEACTRIIQLLFVDYRVRGIRAEVDTRNMASIRLLERLGFTRTGYQANADFFKGSSSDEYTYCVSSVEHIQGAMMELDRHYVDPRLVELYDIENMRGADTDFYVRLAADLDARRILDLGCGTGLLTRELAVDGRLVVGVDPAPAMLDYARRQPSADRVQWIEGYSGALGTPDADLVIMTGNVAQVFLDDSTWAATLRDIHAALRPGGHLAFESRNPDDRAWERWNREATYEQIDSPHGRMECWLELISVGNGRVRFEGHNVFAATGEIMVVSSELRFRSLAELTDSLINAGFTVEQVYGDWHRGPLVSSSRVMVIVARRA